MLAYAPRSDQKKLRPATLGLIIVGHVGLVALVMTAKSAQLVRDEFDPTVVVLVPNPKPPPPTKPEADPKPSPSIFTTVKPIVPPPIPQGPTAELDPRPLPPPSTGAGGGTDIGPPYVPLDPPKIGRAHV